MATILSFLSGRQITNDSGVPQAGAKIYHYRANTTTALTVWQDADASVAHAQPVVCDAGGFVPLIYVDDTFDWKVEIDTSADVSLPQYSFDDLPAAEADAGAVGFAPPLLAWTQVTSGASPVALTANDAGKAYEADTTGGSIEFDLPDAASVGNGKGFWFKKTASANTMTIDPNGSQTIDDSSTSLAITQQYHTLFIASNGAEWYIASQSLEVVPSALMTTASDTAQGAIEVADQAEMEAGSSTARAVTPGRQQHHPGHPKFWAYAEVSGGVPALTTSYNVTSITDFSTGVLIVTIATDFASADWACVPNVTQASGASFDGCNVDNAASHAAGSVALRCMNTGASAAAGFADPAEWHVVGFGDQ